MVLLLELYLLPPGFLLGMVWNVFLFRQQVSGSGVLSSIPAVYIVALPNIALCRTTLPHISGTRYISGNQYMPWITCVW